MEQKDADKIREIILPENLSKLSISELSKHINLINSIFPKQATDFFGTSDVINIRQTLSTTLQIRIFKIALRFTVSAFIISILALAFSIWGTFYAKPIPVYVVKPPLIDQHITGGCELKSSLKEIYKQGS